MVQAVGARRAAKSKGGGLPVVPLLVALVAAVCLTLLYISSTVGVGRGKPPTGPTVAAPVKVKISAQTSSTSLEIRDSGLPDYLKGTAIFTMAAGDNAGRGVITLIKTLRDVKTQVPEIVVMMPRGSRGSDDCQNWTWRAEHNFKGHCIGNDTTYEHIISERYLKTLRGLGAQLMIIDPIPQTPYTEAMPGGAHMFWGMALNKLKVFNMTQYRKILWMDSDVLILKNVDHLLQRPMFTCAFTYGCCHVNAAPAPSGGFYIVEPSTEIWGKLWHLMSNPVPGWGGDPPEYNYWHYGDMQLTRYLFGDLNFTKREKDYLFWPFIFDKRHGYVEGLWLLPENANKTQAERDAYVTNPQGVKMKEGFLKETWDGKSPVWQSLSILYDQCVGHCWCFAGRDIFEHYYSLHYSCIPADKPLHFRTEYAFFNELLVKNTKKCHREYFLLWYERFYSAHGRLDEPYWPDNATVILPEDIRDERTRAFVQRFWPSRTLLSPQMYYLKWEPGMGAGG